MLVLVLVVATNAGPAVEKALVAKGARERSMDVADDSFIVNRLVLDPNEKGKKICGDVNDMFLY